MEFFWWITLHCLTGRNFGLYYVLDIDYASLIWAELGYSIYHSNMIIKVSSAQVWSLIFHEVYTQEGIPLPTNDDVATFAQMTITKSTMDDPVVFLVVGRIPDSMLNLVSPTNKLLIKYKASMDPNPTGIIPKNVTFEEAEGSSIRVRRTRRISKL